MQKFRVGDWVRIRANTFHEKVAGKRGLVVGYNKGRDNPYDVSVVNTIWYCSEKHIEKEASSWDQEVI